MVQYMLNVCWSLQSIENRPTAAPPENADARLAVPYSQHDDQCCAEVLYLASLNFKVMDDEWNAV
tara:strand:+ start:1508 stop:1702 length:195 start_codon:yes stop_codon:yes gene_type:complete